MPHSIANFFADASLENKGMSLALREAAARCATRGIFLFCLTHVRGNLQYHLGMKFCIQDSLPSILLQQVKHADRCSQRAVSKLPLRPRAQGCIEKPLKVIPLPGLGV